MNKFYNFSLEGVGHLEEMFEQDGKSIARINMLLHPSALVSDCENISFDCVIPEDLLITMEWLQIDLLNKRAVILKFRAQYLGLDYCHECVADEDPERIMTFKAKLHTVDEAYVNGMKVCLEQAYDSRRLVNF